MSGEVKTDDGPLVVAVAVDDPALAERLLALLGGVAGLRLARPGEAADAVLSAPDWAPAEARPEDEPGALTPREREVLALMATGASNKAIARALGISVHTAKFHVGQVTHKLDATGRTDAVAQAARSGVIHL